MPGVSHTDDHVTEIWTDPIPSAVQNVLLTCRGYNNLTRYFKAGNVNVRSPAINLPSLDSTPHILFRHQVPSHEPLKEEPMQKDMSNKRLTRFFLHDVYQSP